MPTFKSMRFGTLQYDENDVLLLPEGLIGLPQLRRWLMLDMEEDVPLRWLQSLDRPDFGLPVMPPLFFADEYEIETTITARRMLSSDTPEDLVTLIIANIHCGGEMITGNLRAPLVLDTVTRRGVQLALDSDELPIRQEIDYLKFALALASEPSENEDVVDDEAAEPSAEAEAAPSDANTESLAQTVASGI